MVQGISENSLECKKCKCSEYLEFFLNSILQLIAQSIADLNALL